MRRFGAEQVEWAGGFGQRRRPGAGVLDPSWNMNHKVMFHEGQHAKHAQPSDDNIKDGTEDANHNGKIDGDNGDGLYSKSEIWTETSPNLIDSDGDSFNDGDEYDWNYDPLSNDTDGDGLLDNEEDTSNYGTKDSTETSVIKSDTDGDGLSDKMELDGWKVIIILEATLEIEEERDVTSDPLDPDSENDGINDCGEFENGTDPNDDDTDGDGKTDKEEIEFDYGSSPTGKDGRPPVITDFKASYLLTKKTSGPLWDLKIVFKYKVKIEIIINDEFGLDWINVYLKEVGEEKKYYGELKNISNEEFYFTLDVKQASKSFLLCYNVNISSSDKNNNHGYKHNRVSSISERLIESMLGKLVSAAIILIPYITDFSIVVLKILNEKLNILDKSISFSLKAINNIKRMSIFHILYDYLEYFINLANPLVKYCDNMINEVKDIIKEFIVSYLNYHGIDIDREMLSKDYVLNTINNFDFRILNIYNDKTFSSFLNIFNTLKRLILNPLDHNVIISQLYTDIDNFENNILFEIQKYKSEENIEEVFGEESGPMGLTLKQFWCLVGSFSLLFDIIVLIANFAIPLLLCTDYAIPSPYEKIPVWGVQLIICIIGFLAIFSFTVDLASMTYFYPELYQPLADVMFGEERYNIRNKINPNKMFDIKYSIVNSYVAFSLNIIPNIVNTIVYQWWSLLTWSSTLLDIINIALSHYYINNWEKH